MATSGKKKHTLNCNFTWQSQISIDLGRLSIFIFRLKNWVILGELPQSNQPFLVDCRIAGGAHWANPDISETVYSFMVEFSWQKNDVQDGPPASFKKKKLQVEVCLMFMTGLSEACPYCFPMFSLPNLQFSMYKSLSGRTGVLISWPL